MKTYRNILILLAALLIAYVLFVDSDDVQHAQQEAQTTKAHLLSGQQKVLEDAKAVSQQLEDAADKQRQQLEELR